MQKLDLNLCLNDDVLITIPYKLDEDLLLKVNLGQKVGYEILNQNSTFYTDICIPFLPKIPLI